MWYSIQIRNAIKSLEFSSDRISDGTARKLENIASHKQNECYSILRKTLLNGDTLSLTNL